MDILVIGGTYFLGKAFVDLASENNVLTLINRGNRKADFKHSKNIRQIKADRHNLGNIDFPEKKYDVVVDFCAYKKGDIKEIIDSVPGISQYIFISTSDVYRRGTKVSIDENSELETRDFGGAAGDYISGKVALEEEIRDVSDKYGITYSVIRPTFIYGPGNYADRESIFFEWIEKASQILFPKNSTGTFQMVYVYDVAKAILEACGNSAMYNKAINITGKETVSYESFAVALQYALDRPFDKIEISIDEINERQIPLPFPLTEEESESYISVNSNCINLEYISLEEGLRKTYQDRLEQSILPAVDRLFDDNNPKGAENYMLSMLSKSKNTDNISMELTVLNELIGYYRQTSEKDQLISTINNAFYDLEKLNEKDTLRFATVSLNAANAYRSVGSLEDAAKYYEITEKIYNEHISRGLLDEDDMLVAGLHNNMSLLCQELGDYISSENHLKEALKIVKSKNAGFEIAVTYANLANTCVMAKAYDKAKEYAYTAIRLFKARAYVDAHCGAAMSALGTCFYEENSFEKAAAIFREAMKIVENTIGQNSQYLRLKDNLIKCEEKIKESAMTGMELSKKYYDEYGRKMISEKFSEYESKIAVGLAGEGSDCYGFDDSFSIDHDFGPDFCMWVSDETYEEIGEKLKVAYAELPDSFMGYKRTTTSVGNGRRGVIKISDYYKKFLGTDNPDEINYSAVADYAISACVNGEVFRDDEGLFSKIREIIKAGYPAKVQILKIAEEAAGFSQCAQYNYLRMLNRSDEATAQIMLSDGMKHAMKLFHFISNEYTPHDKWLFRSTKNLPGADTVVAYIEQIMNQFITMTDKSDVATAIEELGAYFARIMYDSGIISDVNSYLDYHTEELIFKAGIIENSDEDLVDRIVRLEFEAFDKVKNEGGRAYCQNDWPTFSVMRKSQYLTWNRDMLMQYYYDFSRQYNMGHNLITEKYGRMMESTDSDRWNEIKDNFPELSDEKRAVIEQIVGIQMQMMEEFASVHPKVAGNARTLHTYEDDVINTSYETYLRGEVSTYSDKMLQLYGKYVVDAYRNGVNIADITMGNTAMLYGYKDITDFENAIH